MLLREYSRSDLSAIYALDQICFTAPFRFSERAMRQFAESSNALTIVAETDGEEIAGFCIAHVERAGQERAAYIVTLDVAAEHRRRGLACEMMSSLEQKARAAGCAAVELHVWVENDAAIAFYEREGYERVGLAKSFYGAGRDGYVYRKELGAPSRIAADQNLKR